MDTEAPASEGTILIVDDNLTNLQVLFRTLRDEGYHVVPAQGAASAFIRLEHLTPDLILLDIMMPEVDGFECYRRLREHADTVETPVIFISALNDDEAITRAFHLGAVDYVTKPFRSEEILARVRRQMALTRMHRQLTHSMERAEAANRAKSAFLANMSHELRTPLNAILGFAQVMERDASLPDHQRHRAQMIQRGGEYLLALINDVLDLSKIEAGRFDVLPRDWEVWGFFEHLHHAFQLRAEARGLELILRRTERVPKNLHCDNIRLRQILNNLLGNAIKFTDKGGVTLSVDWRSGRLRVEVVDTGVGMTAAELAQAFDPFTQVGQDDRKQEGTGLGLAITQRLVEAMGGEMEVESELGQGSRFIVDIPAGEVRFTQTAASQAATDVIGYLRRSGEGPFCLLVVDDRADNRTTLREMLSPLGFSVTEAENGEACLARVAAERPDAVLMDLRMPAMSGLEATRILRALPEYGEMAIIAVSASAFMHDKTQALDAGCNAHVSKPVILKELLAALEQHLPLSWVRRADDASLDKAVRPFTAAELAELGLLAKKGAIGDLQSYLKRLHDSAEPPHGVRNLYLAAKGFDLKQVRRLLASAQRGGSDAAPVAG